MLYVFILVVRLVNLKYQVKPESGPHPEGAFKLQLAPHQFDQLVGNAGTKARATILASYATISLDKWIHDGFLFFRVNANTGINNFKTHPCSARVRVQQNAPKTHSPLLGKLDRVTKQIDQYLVKMSFIPYQVKRNIRVDCPGYLNTLFLGLMGKHAD